jgi:dihydroorotase
VFDLGIENGVVVSPDGSRRMNVYIRDERIAAVTSTREPAAVSHDAQGLFVMPGMIDTHVHFMDPGAPEREDFPSGSAAAARAGVTTVIEHTHARPVRTVDDLKSKRDYLNDRSYVDFALAAHAWPGVDQDLGALWREGAAFFKAFTCATHGLPAHDAGALRRLFRALAEIDAVCLVHCEDDALTRASELELRADGREDGAIVGEWRNAEAELIALGAAVVLARDSTATVVAAHVSSPPAVDLVARARREGATVAVETCPQYLSLLAGEAESELGFRKFTPPARATSQQELDAMWRRVADGSVQLVSSDHAPATRAQKTEGSIWDVHFGLPGIDTTLAVLLDGARQGRLTYERLVELYAEAPARQYGFYPMKGCIAPGSDADVTLVDPDHAWKVTDEEILSRAGWSPFAERTLHGRAVATFLRGREIMAEQQVIGVPGYGQFLPGAGGRSESVTGARLLYWQ